MVLLGYEESSKAYRLYDPKRGKVVISRDVVFNEKAAWDWDSPGMGEAGGFTSTFVVERMVIHGGGDAGEEVSTTPAIEPSTPGAVSSTPGGVPSTVEGVPSTSAAVLSAPTVMPTTSAVVPGGPAAMPTTLAE